MRQFANMDLPTRQRGAALLILLAILSVAVIYAVVAGLNRSAGDLARARDQKTYAALARRQVHVCEMAHDVNAPASAVSRQHRVR